MATERQIDNSWRDLHEWNGALEQNADALSIHFPGGIFQAIIFNDKDGSGWLFPAGRLVVDSMQIVAEIQGVEARAGGVPPRWRLHPDHNKATNYDRQ